MNIEFKNIDNLEFFKTLSDKSIDLVITDPPYLYENINEKETTSTLSSLKKFRTGLTHISQGFDNSILDEFKRVCKIFNAFIFCNNRQITQLMNYGESNGYSTNLLVWHKKNAVPFAHGTWKSDLEFIVHIREKGSVFQGKSNVKSKLYSSNTIVSQYGHPTEKPLDLIEKFVLIGSNENDTILDCYAGSGTTAIACIKNNRNFKGCEINETYYNTAKIRIDNEMSQKKLF